MISINNSLLIPAIISLIVLIAIIKVKATDRPVGLEAIIYDKVDKRKYPKIHNAQKANNNKGSGKLNSPSGQDDSLFKIGVGDKMDFGNAIRELKNGKALYRKGWNGKNICIKLMKASDSQDMTQDYIYIDTTNLKTDNRDAPKSKVPWLASQTDLLANDWQVK